ncbi:hypothetical protein G647_04923 [Cladophialophora carrionii CBS 160.54]|uniref:Rad21/Rec8-like protein N-terminal domain-containing protein n=1 Tax=Cladophialophora carrionii CBS 160.54 TaxID=1279043 RepID=V9D8X5_9EURO|nr:uncharacterized protein G647_04923 [Cladophialophora carrionii CBS 160.54]ETI23126.1 hypothetical protein G647_04923 [Cladophialophora carrionii CBS 160.54]
MFYSHEILTNRQYGVATIWLVATLGSKSNLKKITRRAILDVDLLKACKTITEPEVPLALRLQGSLLFGVSRVFQQQCGYVLTDVTSLRDNMRSRVVLQEMELDPEVGKTRPEQLNLAEDPYFMPEIDINFDLSAFGFSSEGSSASQNGSSMLSLHSSQSSLHYDEEAGELGLNIPSLSTPAAGSGGLEILAGLGTSSAAKTGSRVGRLPSIFGEEPAIIDDPVFDVDDDGFLRPAMPRGFVDEPELPSVEAQTPHGSDTRTGGQPRTEHLSAAGEDEPMLNFDDDMVVFGDDEPSILPAAPQIPLTPEPDDENTQQDKRASSSVYPTEESSVTADALQRPRRTTKAIQPDRETELTNRALNEWNQNYLGNMALALRARQRQFSGSKAKRNAEFWVFLQGLGNVASTFGVEGDQHPLAVFSGQSLWDMLKGPERGTKRARTPSVTDDEQLEERRVRARTTPQEEVVRGADGDVHQLADEDGLMILGDDFEIDAEVGRHAPPSLPDHSSGMPWNLSLGGSRQSSIRPPGSGLIPRLSSSVGGLPGGLELGPLPTLSRRGSRLTSASPLFGRGVPLLSRHSSQGPGEASRLTSNEDEFADLDAQLGAGLDPDFELYGPSATVDTQTAAQSQWVAATLENEAYNFLAFVNTKVQEKAGLTHNRVAAEEIPETQEEDITLDELLPPTQNSAIVGAQALLHVLALATKGLLEVYQADHFGEIQISVVSH